MSLVSNYIGTISPSQFAKGNTPATEFDLNDTTFSDLLDKQMQGVNSKSDGLEGTLGSIGIPSGFQIQDLNPTELTEKAFNQVEAVGEKIETQTDNSPLTEKETTSSEFLTFFSSLLDTPQNSADSNLMNFARKQAANFYGKYSQNVITNVNEFVEDIQSLIK